MTPRDELADRLRTVQWRDLVPLRRVEIARELLLSAPWLAASLLAAQWRLYPLALAASFLFFLTSLRQVHNAYHHALSLSRGATDAVMFVLSALMLGSMHAIKINHLRHHSDCLGADDVEAMSARLPAWRALLIGPWFPLRLHATAWRVGTAQQRVWMLAELGANLIVVALVFAVLRIRVLEYHLYAMAIGQCLTAFFAVWTVHHDSADAIFPARSIRDPVKARLTYAMFYHLEHHLFPAVPTCRLPILAARLDRVAPKWAALRVF